MANEVDDGKICALLGYIFPIGLIWFLVDEKMKKNAYAKYHVEQGLMAAIVIFVGYVASAILTLVLIGIVLYFIVSILALVWFIQGLIFSLGGQKKELWLLGKNGHKIKL